MHTVSQAIKDQITDTTVDLNTGEILTPAFETEEDYDEFLYRARVRIWPATLAIALDEIEALTGRRRMPAGSMRYWLIDNKLLYYLRATYPQTWVDQAQMLVLSNTPADKAESRLAELQSVLIEFVTADDDFNPLFKPCLRWRSKRGRKHIEETLIAAGYQKRTVRRLAWVIAYIRDCITHAPGDTAYRSLDQILVDIADYVDIKYKNEVSRLIAAVTAGWSKKVPRLAIFQCIRKGERNVEHALASEYQLTEAGEKFFESYFVNKKNKNIKNVQ